MKSFVRPPPCFPTDGRMLASCDEFIIFSERRRRTSSPSLPRFSNCSHNSPIFTSTTLLRNTMAGKVALITGITGQDGSYLTELLVSKGYTVSYFDPSVMDISGRVGAMGYATSERKAETIMINIMWPVGRKRNR